MIEVFWIVTFLIVLGFSFLCGAYAHKLGYLDLLKKRLMSSLKTKRASPFTYSTYPESEFWNPKFEFKTYFYYNQFKEIQEYYTARINEFKKIRESFWSRNFENLSKYEKSVEENRLRFINFIGGISSKRPLRLLKRDQIRKEKNFTVERVIFESRQKGITVDGFLLKPIPQNKEVKLATIIALHGLSSSPQKVVGLSDKEDYTKKFGMTLLKKGYIVFAPFLINHGEKRVALTALVSIFGDTIFKVDLTKIISSIDFLQSLPEVNKEKIGIYGISYGGALAIWAAVIDRRIKAVVSSGYFRSRTEYLVSQMADIDRIRGKPPRTTHFIFQGPFNMIFGDAEIASLLIPTPLLIVNGTKDKSMFMVEEEFKKIYEIYKKCGIEERIRHEKFEGYHEIGGTQSFKWFDKWLKNDRETKS